MPAPKKLLPRPCPQCGLENGGCQWVIFNPRFYKKKMYYSNKNHGWSVWEIPKYRQDSYDRYGPYVILRISHYSKEQYSPASKYSKKNRTKIWHTFQMPYAYDSVDVGRESVKLSEIFNRNSFKLKHSISFPMSNGWFEYIKKNGWPAINLEMAHWVNRSVRFENQKRGRNKRVKLSGYLR